MRALLKSVVGRSVLAQRVYGGLLYSEGHRHLRAGRNYQALDAFCQACRHIPSRAITRGHASGLDAVVRATCFRDDRLVPHAGNRLVAEYRALDPVRLISRRYSAGKPEDRVRLRWPSSDSDPGRQGNLIILKRPDRETGERGVLLLKYNVSFEEFPAVFDLPRISQDYRIVLEPSTSNYIEAYFFLYVSAEAEVVIQCTRPADYDFFARPGLNFQPVRLGGGDWVDNDLFRPDPGTPRDYDLAMVASWAPFRRHEVLFRALAKLRPRHRYRVALVGYPEQRSAEDLAREARAFGVEDQCEILESVPPERVASILSRSKAALLLTKFEGSNKGIHEALSCDTPIIVYRHHVGLNMDYVNPMTGTLADDDELADAIERVVSSRDAFRPREWVLAHTGYRHSTGVVNEALRSMAEARGEPWTRDLVEKVNRPHLRYKHESDRIAMEPAYEELQAYLLP